MKYPICYLARFVIEADTPLAVGTSEKDSVTDVSVAKDVNDLPMIPGTALCGVLRHSAGGEIAIDVINSIFGFQEGDEGKGSRLTVSDALLVGKAGQVIEGITGISLDDDFYGHFLDLPVRQHCRINSRGAADEEKHGKFDNQAVFKGTRFVFELELAGDSDDQKIWDKLVAAVKSPLFRLGGGTRKGFGALNIVGLEEKVFDLRNEIDCREYLDRSSSLAENMPTDPASVSETAETPTGYTHYRLNRLKAEDFFLFGSGFGDDAVDIRPVFEKILCWQANEPVFSNELTLIPAASIKGALSHRTAFHYNRLMKVFADDPGRKRDDHTMEENKAVAALFGRAKGDTDSGRQGLVIFSDMFLATGEEKILNHVAIDRFSGGAIRGALFNERVLADDQGFTLEILVNTKALDDNNILQAFECALQDVADDMLPLGGGVMRGHGVFIGRAEKKEGGEGWQALSGS